MKTQKILFLDIDHTLYDPIKKEIPASTIDAIKRVSLNQDLMLAIATGRAKYMLDILKPIEPYIDIYITINGKMILYENNIIYDDPMKKEDIEVIKDCFKRHNMTFGYIGKNSQGINKITPYVQQMFDEASMPLPDLAPEYAHSKDVYQMWAFSNDTTLKDLKGQLKDYILVPWLSDGFDIVTKGHDKISGIRTVLDHFNISMENAYAIGDGENDIEMLKTIPNSAAMGNAKPHVKAVASFVTKPYDEDGISHALKHFKLL